MKKVKKKNELATGIISIHPRGFGFLQPEDKEKCPVDVFIPARATKNAVTGDSVEVEIFPNPSEKGPEGKVTKILKRGRVQVGGIVCARGHGNWMAFVPLLGEEWMQINHTQKNSIRIGDRILIKVVRWGSSRHAPLGNVVQFLGNVSDPSSDVPAAIAEYGLDASFPPAAILEAQAYGDEVNASDISEREDLRNLECFTIDPDTAKDFDDAVSVEVDERGNFQLGVHIADVSFYVKPGTELDLEAKKRRLSVYFPGSVLPMLPHELSSHLCSLKPKVDRLAISIFVTLDPIGTVLNYRIVKSVIKSQKRFTYKEAKEILDGKKSSPHRNTLNLMVDLCHKLKRKRYERGSIEFALPDIFIPVDDNGVPQKIETIEYDITHQLIEEFMLKANEIVARHLTNKGISLTYRVHEEPNPETLREFAALARSFGFSISVNPTIEELQQLFDEVRQQPVGQFLTTAFIKSMKLASYSTQNVGHYGLMLDHYTHFTSPIRRYIDLVIHRLLFNEVPENENLDQIALFCSEKERVAAKAEQSVLLMKKLRLLEKRKQESPAYEYEAVITKVRPVGFAFEVIEFMYEGFMFTDSHFLESNKQFRSGDRIKVFLDSVNLIFQKTEWHLIPSPPLKRGRKK